eukprot:364453-Chlamydomonas_euryale.AAC.2
MTAAVPILPRSPPHSVATRRAFAGRIALAAAALAAAIAAIDLWALSTCARGGGGTTACGVAACAKSMWFLEPEVGVIR